MFALLYVLAAAGRAWAWEQLYASAELTFLLGARHPVGAAVSASFAEAPQAYGLAPDLRVVAEAAVGPGGPTVSLVARAGLMTSGNFSYTHWIFNAGPEAYAEAGGTWRPRSWSGLRVGGGLSVPTAAVRYHQLVPLTAHLPDYSGVGAAEALPLPERHPHNATQNQRVIALAFEPWLRPGLLQSVYRDDYTYE